MHACSAHVPYQLPNEHSRVGFLLDGIENDDAGLQAAMVSVEDNTGPTKKWEDFESVSAHLLSMDLVAKKRALQPVSAVKRESPLTSQV